MNHFQKLKAEIAAGRLIPKPVKPSKRRAAAIRIARTDADALRFIAGRLEEAGMRNFAAELERIAANSVPAQGKIE